MRWTSKKIVPQRKKRVTNAKGNLFSIPFIGAVIHNSETKELLRSVNNSTLFIRNEIVAYAENLGFEPLNYGDFQPDYIDSHLWTKIVIAQQKSHYVDYNYAIAFYWLLSLPEYQKYTKSGLIRKIILR